jgi:hypothetical protein
MPSPSQTANLIKGSFEGDYPSFVGDVVLGIPLRMAPVKITGTSVLTTTTLTAATHANRPLVFSSGTSLGLLRHRVKLPAASAGTSGNTYIIVSNINGTPTSNGIVVRPGTTTNRIGGTTVAGGAIKGSTRGNRGAYLALVSDGLGNYFVVGKGDSMSGAATSLQWRSIA